MNRRPFLLLFFLLWMALPAFSLWMTLKTEAFTVFYPEGREQQATEILQVLEYYRGYTKDLVGGSTRRVAIVLEDVGVRSNGLTDVAYHRILLFRSPPSSGALAFHQNWWRLVGVHEYTHWQHLSARDGLPALLTALFGNAMAPGNYTPSWLKEGICVVAESGMSPYEGRLNEGLFDAYTTILAQTGSLPSIVQASYNLDIFPGGTGPYLLGGQFVEFLLRKYGREQVTLFFMHFSASVLSYLSPALPAVGIDRSARRVFGESIRRLWLEWQLEAVKTSVSFKRPGKALTDDGWWLDSPVVWKGRVYYQRSFPVKSAPYSTTWKHQLVQLDPDSGTSLVLFRSSAPFTGPMRVRSGVLYYAVQEIEGGYDNHVYDRFGFTSVLYSRDLESRRSRKLVKEAFRTFEILEDGTILTVRDRRDAFGSEIWMHDPTRGSSELILQTDLLVSDIAAKPEILFVGAREDWDNFQLYRVDLPGWSGGGRSLSRVILEDFPLLQLHDTPFQEAELCFAEDRIFYSATYNGKRTLYEYELETGAVLRSVSSDFARAPAWDREKQTVYYIGLNAGGEDLYREKRLERKFSVPTADPGRSAPTPAELAIPEQGIRRGGYWDNLASLVPRNLYPLFELDINQMTYQVGTGITGVSALGDLRYILLGYYDSVDGRPEMEATLQSSLLAPLTATLSFSTADLYELSASLEWPLYRSLRKGFSYLALGATGILEWGEQEESRVLAPFSVVGFQGASSSLGLQVGVLCVHDVDASVFGYALRPKLYASVVFLGAELSLQATGLYDLQGLENWTLPAVPGYPTDLEAGRGGLVFSSLSIPLLQLRGGLWNPGLYFGDLFVVPFFSSAFNQDAELQLAYGGMLHLELKTGAINEGYPLDLYAGYGMTLEGQPIILLGVEILGLSSGYSRGARRGSVPQAAQRIDI
jgi:hypothetical protein